MEQPVPPVSNSIIGLDEAGALKIFWRSGDSPLDVGFDSNYSFTDVTVKSNRTGNIPRQWSGLSCRLSQTEAGSLTRFTASIIKHLMLHRKGDRTRQISVGVFGVALHLLVRLCFSYPKCRNDWIRTNDTCALQDVRPLHHACGRV